MTFLILNVTEREGDEKMQMKQHFEDDLTKE